MQADVIKKWLVPIAKLDAKDKKPAKTPLEELQGTWHPVAGEFKGKSLTIQELEQSHDKLVIEKDRFMEVMGDFGVEAILKIDAAKKPRAFDLFSRTNMIDMGVKRAQESRIWQGIYELDGDTMKIAMADDDKVRPTEFKTTADSSYAVITYKRGEPPAKPDPQKQPEFVEAEVTLNLGVDEGVAGKELKKTVKDKATLAKFVACFPEIGRGKKSVTAGGWIARVRVKFTGSKGEVVTVHSTWTNWSEGSGDWLVKANLMKYTGELFEVPRLIDQGNLMDDWQLVTFEEGGKKRDTKNVVFDVTHSALELRVGDAVEWEAEYTIRPGLKPKEIDLVIESGTKEEKTYRGIYASEGDVLKICFDKGGTKRPTEFKAANAGEVLLVLKRK